MFGIPDAGDLASDLRGSLYNAMNSLELPGKAFQGRGLEDEWVMRGRHATQSAGCGKSGRRERTGCAHRQRDIVARLVKRSLG